ncbi:21227_t:CDS:1, partial [Gigaspora margarita]
AFEECKNWICMKLPNVRKISVGSTSEAAKIASFSHSASLSNISCSTLYNRNVLETDICDLLNNKTTFVFVSNHEGLNILIKI